MNHEAFHELLALRLYGELATGEKHLLDAHLESCATCATFASQLEATLGQLAGRGAASTAGLPADWSERLRARTREEPAPRRLQPLAWFGAGLAAGLLLMASLRTTATPPRNMPGPADVSITHSSNAGEDPSFAARSAPPPRTTSGGSLARLATLLGR